MAQEQKSRKGEAVKAFEEAENAGRFAGDDIDAKVARAQAEEAIRQDTEATRSDRNSSSENQDTDQEARRDPAQSQDYKGESQNVNDDNGRPLTEEDELEHARNKANSGNQS